MKNIFDKYFEHQEKKTLKTIKVVCEYIDDNYIEYHYTTDDTDVRKRLIREQIVKLIVKCLEDKNISITNTELNLIMKQLRATYHF